MKKRFLKTKPVCKVTFELPPEATGDATEVALAGEFNDWDAAGSRMKRRKDGSYSITLDLPVNREYQFKYLIDGRWENDWNADAYRHSHNGGHENSVVIV